MDTAFSFLDAAAMSASQATLYKHINKKKQDIN